MKSVEIGHLYVGDPLADLDTAILVFQRDFQNWDPILMIDDYSRVCDDPHVYAQSVISHLTSMHGVTPRIVFESQMVSLGRRILSTLAIHTRIRKYPGKQVHFFYADRARVKIAETHDNGHVKFSCPCLVAALTLHRREVLGATHIVSILPAHYADNEANADRLAGAMGVQRDVVLV